jgi:hypothetical protein
MPKSCNLVQFTLFYIMFTHAKVDYVFRIDEVICCLPHVRADYVFHMMRLSVVYLTPELIMCSA